MKQKVVYEVVMENGYRTFKFKFEDIKDAQYLCDVILFKMEPNENETVVYIRPTIEEDPAEEVTVDE